MLRDQNPFWLLLEGWRDGGCAILTDGSRRTAPVASNQRAKFRTAFARFCGYSKSFRLAGMLLAPGWRSRDSLTDDRLWKPRPW